MSASMSDLAFERGSAAEIGPKIRKKLEEGETVTLQVSGDSMRPTLHPRRDAAVLQALDAWPPKYGDILFFQRGSGEYVLHRVIRVRGDVCFVNGDAQNWTEGPVTRGMAIAKAIALIRGGRPVDPYTPLRRVGNRLWALTRPFRFQLFALWRKMKGISEGEQA